MMKISDLVSQSYQTAFEKGWWDGDSHNVPEKIALMHSELSEALEEYRKHKELDEVYYREDGKPEGFIVELADVLIRIGDLCGRYDLNLENAIRIKMEFNKNRTYRHGGKKA